MTPYEMRQQAYRYRTEANVLEESAQILRSVAGSVRGLLSGIAGISRMVWQGPAATQFEEEAVLQSRNLDQQADEISGEAAGFDSKSASLRSSASWLLHEAARIEAQQASAAAGAAPPNVY
jgi:uncharacterized protein YukE